MFYRYRFESDMYPALSRIPLHVRMKLDITGVKISLKNWLAFAFEERMALCHLPVDAEEEKRAFVSYLDSLTRRYFGEPATAFAATADLPWKNLDEVPDCVRARSREAARAVTAAEWRALNSCQRYALYKLSISRNEPEQFFDVLEEFREGGSDKP